MPVQFWLNEYDKERLAKYALINLEHYAGEGRDELLTGKTEQSGIFSHLKKDFVLGKVRFFEREGSNKRTPFLRVDNYAAYPDGIIFTPNSWINVRYIAKGKTIDQVTKLKRIELLAAPDNDFIRRVFVTYDHDIIVPKPHEHEQHFLVYCDARHLFNGKVADRHLVG